MLRLPVIFSSVGFGLLALFGYHIFGWRMDGWILGLAAVCHTALVLKWYPRLDWFLVSLHYLLAFVEVAGVLWVFMDLGGVLPRSWDIFLSYFPGQWLKLSHYWFLARYAFLMTLIFSATILAISWILNRRHPRTDELIVGFFVASVLNISCELALVDAFAGMGAFRPEGSRAFIVAFGVENLSFPVILHGIIAILIVLNAWKCRRKSF